MKTVPSQTPGRSEMWALPGIPEVQPGDDLGGMILAALAAQGEVLARSDILVVAQKIVSKAEGRYRELETIAPGVEATALAARTGKDPRKVQAILDESAAIVRAVMLPHGGVLIARHRQGWICANAGIDESNLGGADAGRRLLLLPEDPDHSARSIAGVIEQSTGIRPGVIITDTFGRPWRRGLVNVAIGLSDVPAIIDWIGRLDAFGRPLEVTQQAFADEIAAASGLHMPKDGRQPVVLVRGLDWQPQPDVSARAYVRPFAEDLFT